VNNDKRDVLNGKPIDGPAYPAWQHQPPRSQVWLARFGWATITVGVLLAGLMVWRAVGK
jgi:hypothetical protein